MRLLFSLIFLLLLQTTTVKSLQFSENKSLKISVSDKGLTRLSFKDDKIVDLFVYPGEFQNNLSLHKSGNLFISPGEGTFYMTLIGLSGIKQDFTIVYKEGKSIDPIILEPKIETHRPIKSKPAQEILQDFLITGSSDGFESASYREVSSLKKLNPGLVLKTTGHYRKGAAHVFEGILKNQTDKALKLNTTTFKGFKAVAVKQTHIQPRESITLYFMTEEGAM
ncbi:MAG: hypothetical protein CMM87_06025 [Rickettsiales bacterium]|nr:hypothetical protein [Rickettsiales bacterium]|tara:strand:+ start:7793 stop:8461 length:669 start_codon:yes stop_codon:yes gene_type:complete